MEPWYSLIISASFNTLFRAASEVYGGEAKWMASTNRPRFMSSYAATGESIPPESSNKTFPLIPAGYPPAPLILSDVIYVYFSCTSTRISSSGLCTSTVKSVLCRISPAHDRLISSEIIGKDLSWRFVIILNVFLLDSDAIRRHVFLISSILLSTFSVNEKELIPKTLFSFALISSVSSSVNLM